MNCSFLRNTGDFLTGGPTFVDAQMRFTNCVFSRNNGDMGGGLGVAGFGQSNLFTCTFSRNGGLAIWKDSPHDLGLVNSIVWNSGVASAATVTYSNIQGSHSGEGNISADPLFVQPGSDDLRLALGSPCLDAGSTAMLRPDSLDLDGDGNTLEPLPFDRLGAPRVQGASVDMGAYEGAFEAQAAAASAGDVNRGETVVLVPYGGLFNPLGHVAVTFENVSGDDHATVSVSHAEANLHPDGAGFLNLGHTITLETSLAAGQFRAILMIPLRLEDLGGADPLHQDLTFFDPVAVSWALAVSANATASLGSAGPIGDRVVVNGPGNWTIGDELGDYGVFWRPTRGMGLVWAVVDRAGEFGIGSPSCPADCRQSPDGVVGIVDLLTLLNRWGQAAGGGPCDLDYNQAVAAADLVAMLEAWGPCAPPKPVSSDLDPAVPGLGGLPGLAGMPAVDFDDSGLIDAVDLQAILDCWGKCAAGSDGDFDGDGAVGASDLTALFASWGAMMP